MIEPVQFESNHLLIHSFRAEDIRELERLAWDVFTILSDDKTLTYLAGKRLHSLADAEMFLRTNLLNFHAGQNYLHFISDKETGKVVGLIDLISPGLAKEHYRLGHYPYFIEFLLKSEFQGRGIMGEVLPKFVKQLKEKNIKEVGAVVNRTNTIARKLIQKVDFSYRSGFDLLQDFYTITLN
jgi:RimJ/RimL family protein N-acetyltransferase